MVTPRGPSGIKETIFSKKKKKKRKKERKKENSIHGANQFSATFFKSKAKNFPDCFQGLLFAQLNLALLRQRPQS